MDTTYSKAVALATPVFLTLIAIEMIANWRRRTHCYRLADSLNSLSCGVASTGSRVFFGFLGLYFYEWVLLHWAPVRLPATHFGTWIFALLLYDLCYYWQHRFGHTVGLCWASHVTHHQSEEFNLTTALRQPGSSFFWGWILYMPMAFCGVPVSTFLMVGIIQLFYQFWPHTRLIGRLGFLEYIFQTPSNHRVHHAQNDIYLDKNYVGMFLFWDHLFGTFQPELPQEPCIYGIRGQLKSWNPLWANVHYYVSMAKDSYYTHSWADKVRVWFAPPGWRPADVAARFPKAAYDVHRDFVKFDPPRNLGLSLYVLVQFAVLIGCNSHFLRTLSQQSPAQNVMYFLFQLLTMLCIGGLLENRRVFFLSESLRLALAAMIAFIYGGWFGVHNLQVMAGISGYCLASFGLLWVLSRKKA